MISSCAAGGYCICAKLLCTMPTRPAENWRDGRLRVPAVAARHPTTPAPSDEEWHSGMTSWPYTCTGHGLRLQHGAMQHECIGPVTATCVGLAMQLSVDEPWVWGGDCSPTMASIADSAPVTLARHLGEITCHKISHLGMWRQHSACAGVCSSAFSPAHVTASTKKHF